MSASHYATLRRLGVRTITTAQAAAALGVSISGASQELRRLADAGLVERLRRGLWLLDPSPTAEELAADVTAPFPSYVSHVSALYVHGVIDQVPTQVHLVTVGDPGVINTSRGDYRVHRVPVELFGGFQASRGYPLATAEKALFDWAYVSAASGHPGARLPEREWPASFRVHEALRWVSRIDSTRLRTLVSGMIERWGQSTLDR